MAPCTVLVCPLNSWWGFIANVSFFLVVDEAIISTTERSLSSDGQAAVNNRFGGQVRTESTCNCFLIRCFICCILLFASQLIHSIGSAPKALKHHMITFY
ncbi:hypothetical protein EV424DRAFT_1381822 [Suillus variegatus]|nr:hypothetical protein EV424DRAFT_1381822 [Suillus variegatus]